MYGYIPNKFKVSLLACSNEFKSSNAEPHNKLLIYIRTIILILKCQNMNWSKMYILVILPTIIYYFNDNEVDDISVYGIILTVVAISIIIHIDKNMNILYELFLVQYKGWKS